MATNGHARTAREPLNARRVRRDFPALHRKRGEPPLVYLDSASTAQKPRAVIDRIRQFYASEYANINTPYRLGKHATDSYEAARAAAAKFLHAASPDEIVFVRNTTEAINVVSQGFSQGLLASGDEIVISQSEHHSNIVPWHMACERTGTRLRVAPLDSNGDYDLERLAAMISDRTRLVAVAHVSNVLGGVEPVEEVVKLAHARGVPVLIDGAQAAPHIPVNMQKIGCDFYAFSAHKTYGPSGVGVLYGTMEWLKRLPPSLGGEPMVEDVSFEGWTPKPLPEKFAAGVPALASTISLTEAVEYLGGLGMSRVSAHVRGLASTAAGGLAAIDGVRVVGSVQDRVSVVAFSIDGVEPERVAEFLDRSSGLAVRAGHLSAKPLLQSLGLQGAVRASFGVYNTADEVETLLEAVSRCVRAKARRAKAVA
jgi:cysteine desulfurase/selenocysteine lyase